MVLRAWDTYRRSEEARRRMQQFTPPDTLGPRCVLASMRAFVKLRQNMQLWLDKEEALKPENFDP